MEQEVNKPVRIRRTLLRVPLTRERIFFVNPPFRFRFVVHGIKPNDTLKENVKLRVTRGVFRHLKQWSENV